MSTVHGHAWTYGANIDTDVLAPIGSYQGTGDLADGAKNCLRDVDSRFAQEVQEGDIFVATDNLGIGSSRETAPRFLYTLGIRVVIAQSFARIFYRNCFNIGLPALVCPDAHKVAMGDILSVHPDTGEIVNETQGDTYHCQPIPEHLMTIVGAGGLLPYLKQRLA